jgi:hypothetical protein
MGGGNRTRSVAFEPDPVNCRWLGRNLTLNPGLAEELLACVCGGRVSNPSSRDQDALRTTPPSPESCPCRANRARPCAAPSRRYEEVQKAESVAAQTTCPAYASTTFQWFGSRLTPIATPEPKLAA